MNVSGVVLAKNAPNKANAMKLIEWLASDTAQHMYADINYEYPVKAGIKVNDIIASYGKLKPDPMPLVEDRRRTRRPPPIWSTRSASTIDALRRPQRPTRGPTCGDDAKNRRTGDRAAISRRIAAALACFRGAVSGVSSRRSWSRRSPASPSSRCAATPKSGGICGPMWCPMPRSIPRASWPASPS